MMFCKNVRTNSVGEDLICCRLFKVLLHALDFAAFFAKPCLKSHWKCIVKLLLPGAYSKGSLCEKISLLCQ
jgi:hypothetical protein